MKLYDTLTGSKRDFAPVDGDVKMYVCGPNLYGPCHVGHALSYVIFDVLRRYLEYQGYRVRHVQNFTDIEDRIIETATAEGLTIGDLAEHYINRFLEEMDALGIQRAQDYPRATETIPRIIEIVEGLISKGHAYEVEGDVYFRVHSFPTYGKLSRRTVEEMEPGTRIEVDPRKEDPTDFTLWKVSKEGEPSWPSPWGEGRPGWHIECSAMSLGLLGEQFDIHGGGQDVMFPHHENEIAQSEAYTGKSPLVSFWVHNGLLRPSGDGDEKMTRHTGNFITCRDALDTHTTDAIRLFLLSAHYRSPRAYLEEEISAQERAVDRLRAALRPEDSEPTGETLDASAQRERFLEAMDDDLNTPRAMAVLFDLARDVNRAREEKRDIRDAQSLLRELGGVLGLTFQATDSSASVAAQPFIDLLIQVRTQLRESRQYELADSVRDRLQEMGVALEDSAQGTTWQYRKTGDTP